MTHRVDGAGAHPGRGADAQPVASRPTGTSFAESFAGADPGADAERRTALRRMKAVALGFLVGATVVFLVCRWANMHGTAPAWVGYVARRPRRGWWVPWRTGSR